MLTSIKILSMPGSKYSNRSTSALSNSALEGSTSDSTTEVLDTYSTNGADTSSTDSLTENIWMLLREVLDPELDDNIVDLGMVRSVSHTGGTVTVEIALTIAGCPLRTQLRKEISSKLKSISAINEVKVVTTEMTPEERQSTMARARLKAQERFAKKNIGSTTRVLAISSGKGGVGKSTITAHLALSLARRSFKVGILDADIGGFSIPGILGISGSIEVKDHKMLPVEMAVGEGSLKVLSMEFLAGDEGAIMWRGLLLNKAFEQFLEDVDWGPLDYLLIDMPPGTGDVQMGLARMLPQALIVIVTTPADQASKVAIRTGYMARKGFLRVVGVVENLSYFICEHGTSYEVFGQGGGARLASKLGVPLLARIPLVSAVHNQPAALLVNPTALSSFFDDLADRILIDIAPPLQRSSTPSIDMTGCTARMLSRLESAVATE